MPGALDLDDAVLVQAAEWYALLCSRQVTERDKNRWREWLGAAAEHRLAWRYVEDISGGFAPLLLEPIDFHGLFMQQAQAMQAEAAGDVVVGQA